MDHSGKTANLNIIHSKLRPDHRGELKSFEFDGSEYDVLPIELGKVNGLATRFKIYSLPSEPEEKEVRKELAENASGMVFVVDAQKSKLDENVELYQEMTHLIKSCGISQKKFPVVVQYNKLDLPTAASIDELEKTINTEGFPFFKAVANQGTGVLPTLTTVSKTVIRYLRQKGEPLKITRNAPAPDASLTEDPLQNLMPDESPQASPSTAPTEPVVSVNGQMLQFLTTGKAIKNQDGTFRFPIHLKDPNTGKEFKTEVRLESNFDGEQIIFKLLPAK